MNRSRVWRGTLAVAAAGAVVLGSASPAFAADGTLDTSFGTGGIVSSLVGSGTSINAMVVQSDNKIVVVGSSTSAGNSDFVVIRYTANGVLDNTFGTGGVVTTDFGGTAESASAVAIDVSGNIVVVGNTDANTDADFAVARYTPLGALDTSFDTDGKTTVNVANADYATAVAIDPNTGAIVVVGRSNDTLFDDVAIARLTSAGALDSTFNADGLAPMILDANNDIARGVVVLSDSRIVIVAETGAWGSRDFVLLQLDAAGLPGTLFGGFSTRNVDFGGDDRGAALVRTSDNTIVAVGTSSAGGSQVFAVTRVLPDGNFDTTFDTDGKLTTTFGTDDQAQAVALQSDGKILVAGYSNLGDDDYTLIRLTSTGAMDTTFGTGGVVHLALGTGSYDFAFSVGVQSTGKIIIAGYKSGAPNTGAVARYTGGSSTLPPTGLDGRGAGMVLFGLVFVVAGVALVLSGRTARRA